MATQRKGRVLEVSIREREFEGLLRRASEITAAQRPPLKARAVPRKAPVSSAR